ncbi:hypothetical protein BP422_09760 [Brevibacillus formosus]|uniref:Uncharacterized protein n=1 Tax=Brevibacillus formosus TaxID=54913 RepID=A0A220MH06_9BACL|nr:hypothetical protein BP422_09760 [Brevibacillus formosus]
MGNRELLMVMTLRAITNGFQTAKDIFEEDMPFYPGRSRSMAFLYEILKELEEPEVRDHVQGRSHFHLLSHRSGNRKLLVRT